MTYSKVEVPDPIVQEVVNWKLPRDVLLYVLNTVRPNDAADLQGTLSLLAPDERYVLNFAWPAEAADPEFAFHFFYQGFPNRDTLVVTHGFRLPKGFFFQ